MPEVVCELIVSLDGFAKGQRSPGYFGYIGPDFAEWIKTNSTVPHRKLIGHRTYDLLSALPGDLRDESWHAMAATPGWLFSHTLEKADWPGLTVVRDEMVDFVRELKRVEGTELRTLGSLSLVHQLLAAGLVDRLKLVVCPLIRIPDDQLYIVTPLTPWIECGKSLSMSKSLIIDNYLTGIRMILPQSGAEPTFAGLPDTGLDLLSTQVLDHRVLLLEYRPVGTPPYSA